MNLYHYSEHPWVFDPTRTYKTDVDSMWFKPTGLWLSVDDDWERWCRNNDFAHERLIYRSKIELASRSNVLRLEDEDDIDVFTSRKHMVCALLNMLRRQTISLWRTWFVHVAINAK